MATIKAKKAKAKTKSPKKTTTKRRSAVATTPAVIEDVRRRVAANDVEIHVIREETKKAIANLLSEHHRNRRDLHSDMDALRQRVCKNEAVIESQDFEDRLSNVEQQRSDVFREPLKELCKELKGVQLQLQTCFAQHREIPKSYQDRGEKLASAAHGRCDEICAKIEKLKLSVLELRRPKWWQFWKR